MVLSNVFIIFPALKEFLKSVLRFEEVNTVSLAAVFLLDCSVICHKYKFLISNCSAATYLWCGAYY